MKTRLLIVAMATVFAGHAQRILESTNQSWLYQNTSVETDAGQVIVGFTELDLGSIHRPSFNVTGASGSPATSYNVNFGNNQAYLMDIALNQVNSTIIMTGIVMNSGGTAYDLFLTEVDINGNVSQSSIKSATTFGHCLIPQQVIVSQVNGEVVVVGAELDALPTNANSFTVGKSGFVLGFNSANFNSSPLFGIKTNTTSGGTDADILESVTELPNGDYFAVGSANNGSNQTLAALGFTPSGSINHCRTYIYPNGTQTAGASVLYSNGNGVVCILSNNSTTQTFDLITCNVSTGAPTGSYSYPISGMPIGSGISVNGFRLQETLTQDLVVGGFIYAPTGILPQISTPFQMQLIPGLGLSAARLFQSDNNSTPAPAYFDETGTSVYINTPDMVAYAINSNKTYVVSPNTGMSGYDLDIASLVNITDCEQGINATSTLTTPGANNFTPTTSSISSVPNTPTCTMRQRNQVTLCATSAPFAPFTGSLSPNPATDRVKVELQTIIHDITVIDLKGNKVMNLAPATRSESAMIDISKLTSGMYVVLITDADGNIYRERFVKE